MKEIGSEEGFLIRLFPGETHPCLCFSDYDNRAYASP